MQLILASTSIYRQQLLARLQLPFIAITPDFEESTCVNDNVSDLIRHNTLGKARSVLLQYPDARIIASDQLAICNDHVLGKPGDFETALMQLSEMSGKTVEFLTGLAVIDHQHEHYEMLSFRVWMRALSTAEIKAYLHMEQPFDCAGSFKSEGLGISLFERMEGDDPTALIGLPLIALSAILQPLKQQ